MKQVRIDQGIPIPEPKTPQRGRRYPWAEMEVGDSFFVQTGAKNMHNGYILASRATKNHKPKRFVCRAVKGGTRIWRTV